MKNNKLSRLCTAVGKRTGGLHWITLFILLISNILSSQNPWYTSTFGSSFRDTPFHMMTGGNNQYVVVGGTKTALNTEHTKGFISLLDSSLKQISTHYVNDNYMSLAFRYSVNEGQNFRFIGLKDSDSPQPEQHLFIYVTDLALNPIDSMQVFLCDTFRMVGWNGYLDSDTNLILHGWGRHNHYPGAGIIPFVLKTDINGNLLHRHIGDFGYWKGLFNTAIIETPEHDGYYLFDFYPTPPLPLPSPPHYSALHINKNLKISDSGHLKMPDSIIIQSTNIRTHMHQVYDAVMLASNDLLLFGRMAGIPEDFLIALIDLEGNVNGVKRLRGSSGQYLYSYRAADYFNNCIFISYADSVDLMTSWFPNNTNKLTIHKFDTLLNEEWQIRLGWNAYFRQSKTLATPDGGCIVLASVYDSDTMYLRHDVVLFKLDNHGQLVGVTNLTPKPDDLVLFPNPGTTHFEIGGGDHIDRIEVYDASGRLVRNITFRGNPPIVDMYDAPAGLYVIRATSTTGKTFHPVKWVKGM